MRRFNPSASLGYKEKMGIGLAVLTDVGAGVLRALPPETAHKTTLKLLDWTAPLLPAAETDDARLAITALGMNFANPIGLAAGFDKDAEVPDAMLKLGFGFVECGSVTPRPQEGNPIPRLFRLYPDAAVINRMGFNNKGMEAMAARLAAREKRGIVGINIGANKDSADRTRDYELGFAKLAPFASYITANVSSPNTPGLRGLQNKDELERLLATLTGARARANMHMPILLKIAPDVSPDVLDDIASVTLASGIEGIIATNTTIARPPWLKGQNARESGGLSGVPLFKPSTAILRALRERAGTKLTLVGVGGIASGADAYEKIRAGASLVQLYTALAYHGPGLIARIKRDLIACLERDGFSTIADAVGAGLRAS
ncbi:MAG TPA: quinone-dependent dihydroorotate dehydrogenase [Rhizomicrobium sp.]|nr:quinone-dependent dihydroorotate dehydrogenase [Rhizomicrobium sp.]